MRSLRANIPALCLMLALGPRASAQTDAENQHPIFGTPPSVSRLDNGLTLVTVTQNTPGIVAYYTLVTVGSRDEVEPGRSGFAHLFEHMMFRGTETLPGDEYQRALQSFGADTNAYTTDDYTVYTITAPTSALLRIVELEADRFQNLSYDEEAFRTETGAVLGEYNTGASSPGSAMWERLAEMAFAQHTYGHTTMGYLRDVCAMPEMMAYSLQFFARYYTPDNTTVIAVGDVDHEALLDMVRTQYGEWQGQRHDNQVPTEPEPTSGDRAHIAWSGSTPPRMVIGYRSPAFDGNTEEVKDRALAVREAAALEVVRALAFHESASLNQQLVVEEQRLTDLSSWSNRFSVDPGLFTISARFRPTDDFSAPSSFDVVLDAIQDELGRIASGEVSPERIADVQSHILYAYLSGLETPGRTASRLAGFIAVGRDVTALEEYLAALANLSPRHVAAAAAAYLTPERRLVVTVAQAAEGETPMARPTCADIDAEGTGDE